MLNQKTDEELMALVANGHRLAYDQLVRRHVNYATALARRVCVGHSGDVDDVVQDAFIKLWVSAPQWKAGKGKFTTWFYRVLVNAGIDRLRARKPTGEIDWDVLVDPAVNAEQDLLVREENSMVAAAIRNLPEKQRVALALCYQEGMSNREAADVMNIHIKAYEAQLGRARRALRQQLEHIKKGAA